MQYLHQFRTRRSQAAWIRRHRLCSAGRTRHRHCQSLVTSNIIASATVCSRARVRARRAESMQLLFPSKHRGRRGNHRRSRLLVEIPWRRAVRCLNLKNPTKHVGRRVYTPVPVAGVVVCPKPPPLPKTLPAVLLLLLLLPKPPKPPLDWPNILTAREGSRDYRNVEVIPDAVVSSESRSLRR